MAQAIKAVLIVGSGPCGLLLALMLAQHGIEVQVLEALDDLDKRPRGVGYGPAAVASVSKSLSPKAWEVNRAAVFFSEPMFWIRYELTVLPRTR